MNGCGHLQLLWIQRMQLFPLLQCASIRKHVSKFTFLTPAGISKMGITYRITIFMYYGRNIAMISPKVTYWRGFRQLPRASRSTSHRSSTAVSLDCTYSLFQQVTGNFFQTALWGTFKGHQRLSHAISWILSQIINVAFKSTTKNA